MQRSFANPALRWECVMTPEPEQQRLTAVSWDLVDDNSDPRWKWARSLAFDGASPGICPDCKSRSLRHFHWGNVEGERIGEFWMWCPGCRKYVHETGPVPWWVISNPDIADREDIGFDPTWLEEHYDEIMNWYRYDTSG